MISDKDEGDDTRASGAWSQHQMFADVDAVKAQVRQALYRPEYDVRNFYYEEGVFQYIARSTAFENLTFAVIFLNAFWMSIDTDLNHANLVLDADPVFQI